MTPNEQFFYENAGYSYDPATETQEQGRVKCAKSLAQAEQLALSAGVAFEWQIDQFINSSDFSDDPEPWELWECVAYNADGNVIASLSGIDFGRDGSPWSSNYRRVVEAELATEAMPECV